MSKIGRNDTCPCGSGKKYKKCCLPKEQQRVVAGRRKNNIVGPRQDNWDEFFEDLAVDPAEFQVEDEASEAGAQSDNTVDEEPFVPNRISDDVPEIGERERAIVDAWWTAYKGMKDPDAIIQHLNGFFQAQPGLVPNLELHYEVLFGLGEQLIKAGRASDYIELLLRVRRDFPDAYLKSFGYYDLDIIHYRIASQNPKGVDSYLNWFKEYPDSDPDNLFALVDFLMATGCDQPLIDLIEATYYPVCRSESVISGGEILEPLILSYCAPYLDQGWTQEDLGGLSDRMKSIRIPLNEQWYRPEYLDSLFKEILRELDDAFFATFYDTWNVQEYYWKVTYNFMGWLRREKQFGWMKAQFYRKMVLRYLLYVIPEGKRPKKPFVFSRNLLEDTIGRMCKKILSLDATQTLGALNAVYWFAEYLQQRKNASEQEYADVQGWCEELWKIVMPQFLESTIEARAFDAFPQ